MFTKKELIRFGVKKLADIILSLCQNRPDIQNQLELITADFTKRSEEYKEIEEEIESLKGSNHFIDYYESDAVGEEINQICTRIMEDILPKFPGEAIELLLNMLDVHEEVIGNADDSNGTIGDAFKQVCVDLGESHKYINIPLDDIVKQVYELFMDNNYGIYDNIIENFQDVLGDNGLNLLKEKLKQSLEEENAITIKIGLEAISSCQNNVDEYISACSIAGKPNSSEHLEIARRLITHKRYEEAIKWLDSIEYSRWQQTDKIPLKIQALELCGKFKEAQEERQKWFEITLNHKVYQDILKNGEADFIQSFRTTAIQKALEFSNTYDAVNFLNKIQEFEQAAKLIYQKIDTFDGNNCYTLCSIADVLCKSDPLAATLLYRKMMEPILKLTKSKPHYYPEPAKGLAACQSLSSKITDWKGYKNHQLYFEEVSVQLKRKTSFWREYTSALNEQKAKDTEVYKLGKRKCVDKVDSSPHKKISSVNLNHNT